MVTQRRIGAAALSRIRRLYREEGIQSAGEIERRLIDERVADRPHKRTIQRIIDEYRAIEGEPWSLADAYLLDEGLSVDTILYALEAVAAVVDQTHGRRDYVTRAEVRWIARFRPAFPELPAWTIYAIASQYLAREHARAETRDLDRLLAYAPWRSAENRARYFDAVDEGVFSPTDVALAAETIMPPKRISSASVPGGTWGLDDPQPPDWLEPSERELWLWGRQIIGRIVDRIVQLREDDDGDAD